MSQNGETETGRVGAETFSVSSRPYHLHHTRARPEPDVRKIAVLRSSGIGDYVFALPALEALRAAYPEAEIVYLGLDWHNRFLKGRPGPVDRVEVVPKTRGVSVPEDGEEDIQAAEPFFKRMRAEKFDLALQMHGGGRNSNPFVVRLGARLTAGCRTNDALPLDRWVPYVYYQPEFLRYLEVVSLVGAYPVRLEPDLIVTEADEAEAESVIPILDKPLAILHPGAGDPRRRWPVEKFAEVGNTLVWSGAHVVVTGSEEDRELAEQVASTIPAGAENLAGRLSLGGLVGLISRAAVMVSNDSGPLHLAEAVHTPTVGIYWAGNLINAGPVTRTRHRPVLSWRLDCPVCGLDNTRYSCEHQASFVADVSTLEVQSSALELLEQAASSERKLLPSF